MIVFTRHFKGHLEIALSAVLYQYWHCYCHFKNFIFLLRNFLKKCNISVQYTSVFFLRLSYLAPVSLRYNSSVMRQKGESQNGCFKKTKNAKFSEKQTFLIPWYAHAIGVILVSLLLTLLHTLCVSIVNFEQVNTDWVSKYEHNIWINEWSNE